MNQTIILANLLPEVHMARSLIDIGTLDECVQEQVAKYGNAKDFHIVLWQQEPDATGSNWNARIERIRPRGLNDTTWWDVVPQMRERFNLARQACESGHLTHAKGF